MPSANVTRAQRRQHAVGDTRRSAEPLPVFNTRLADGDRATAWLATVRLGQTIDALRMLNQPREGWVNQLAAIRARIRRELGLDELKARLEATGPDKEDTPEEAGVSASESNTSAPAHSTV